MKRSILLSILVIGAIAAMVTSGSFSLWTDQESASGTVTSGSVALDDGGVETLNISLGTDCPGPIGPGDSCVIPINPGGYGSPWSLPQYWINYTGSLDAHVAISLVVDNPNSCFTVIGTAGSNASGQGGTFILPVGGGSGNYLDPAGFAVQGGEHIPVGIAVNLPADASNDCQNQTVTVTVQAVATAD